MRNHYQDIIRQAQVLSDVELAMLISLMAQEHCILETDPNSLDSLEEEIVLVFSLTSCSGRS